LKVREELVSPREGPFKNIPEDCAIPDFRADFREKSPKTGKKRRIRGYLARFSAPDFRRAIGGSGGASVP